MNHRDNNNELYRIGHIYFMYSHHLEILQFDNKHSVLLRRVNEPNAPSFSLALVNGWKYVRPAGPPKKNLEALYLLEKE